MVAAWHTADAKAEAVLKDYFEQVGQDDLVGWTVMTRYSMGVKTYPQITIVCVTIEDAYDSTVNHTGNWRCSFDIGIKSRVKKQTATVHDNMSGYITDLLMDTELVTVLNALSYDQEIQFLHARMDGRENRVDDGNNTNETVITWRTIVAPFRTTG